MQVWLLRQFLWPWYSRPMNCRTISCCPQQLPLTKVQLPGWDPHLWARGAQRTFETEALSTGPEVHKANQGGLEHRAELTFVEAF